MLALLKAATVEVSAVGTKVLEIASSEIDKGFGLQSWWSLAHQSLLTVLLMRFEM